VGFKPTIQTGERQYTYALDLAANGTGQRNAFEDLEFKKGNISGAWNCAGNTFTAQQTDLTE